MKKIISILLVILCLCPILSLCGCKGNKADVYFLNFKPESAEAYKKIAAAYEEETGVKVKVVTAAANTYEQTLKSEIAKSEPPTIFQINGPVGFKGWQSYCADLSTTEFAALLSDSSLAVKKDGMIYGVPYVVEGYGIIYNDAIMRKYFALENKKVNISSANEINSFEKLKAVVEDMTANKQALGIDGVFASTSLASGEDWRWQTHLANMAFYHEYRDKDDPTTETLNAETIEFKYAENYKNLFDLYINNSVTERTLLGSKSVADSMAEFALGKCAMVQNGTWAWSQIASVTGNTVKAEDIKMLPLYTGAENEENIGICVGTENYLCINSRIPADKQTASLDFLYWLFASDNGKRFVTEELGFTTPFTSLSTAAVEDPLAKEVQRYLNDTTKENIPWVFTGFPGENFKKGFGDALLEYAQGSIDFETLKTRVIDKWKSERSQ